jgi:hypothetical protein
MISVKQVSNPKGIAVNCRYLTLWLAIGLYLGGCAQPVTLSDNPEIAARQLEALIPPGTSAADAIAILRAYQIRPERKAGRYDGEVFDDYLTFKLERYGTLMIETWHCALILEGGAVSGYRVGYWLTGL